MAHHHKSPNNSSLDSLTFTNNSNILILWLTSKEKVFPGFRQRISYLIPTSVQNKGFFGYFVSKCITKDGRDGHNLW